MTSTNGRLPKVPSKPRRIRFESLRPSLMALTHVYHRCGILMVCATVCTPSILQKCHQINGHMVSELNVVPKITIQLLIFCWKHGYHPVMFLRQTKISSRRSGDACTTFRLVASERIGGRVKQRALLNLGTNFSLPKEKWPELCTWIEQILAGQGALFPWAGDIEQEAHRYAALLIGKGGAKDRRDENGSSFDYQKMAVNSLELVRPRAIGVEHVGLAALQEQHIPQIFAVSGLNRVQRDAAGWQSQAVNLRPMPG